MELIKLYQVNSLLEDAIDFETGEIKNEEMFDKLIKAEAEGADYYMGLFKNAQATVAALKNEKKSIVENFDTRINAAEKVAELAYKALEKHFDGKKYESAIGRIVWRKSTHTKEVDKDAFMKWEGRMEFLDYEPKIKTGDILAALRSGKRVEGFELEESNNMTIK